MTCGLPQKSDLLNDGPLCPPETVRTWGRTLVVAPHPDDEVLGCGGAIGLLRRYGFPVRVLFISDGAASHPNSRKFPPMVVREIREQEAREGLAGLGVPSSEITFLCLPDGSLPGPGAAGFAEAVDLCALHVKAFRADTVLLPWRRDPHPDHRASSEIVRAVLAKDGDHPRLLEYLIWAWERAVPGDLPQPGEAKIFRLDIAGLTERKQDAIMAHQSQVTTLIDDDPEGCLLSPEMLAHFARPWETYLEILTW